MWWKWYPHFTYYFVHFIPIGITSPLFSLISLHKTVLMLLSKTIMVWLHSTWRVDIFGSPPLDIFKTLIENNRGGMNIRDNRGKTPFHSSLCEFQLGIHDTSLNYISFIKPALMGQSRTNQGLIYSPKVVLLDFLRLSPNWEMMRSSQSLLTLFGVRQLKSS